MHKLCTKCNIQKSVTEFQWHNTHGRFLSHCNKCKLDRRREVKIERIKNGLCWRCGIEPSIDDKSCLICREILYKYRVITKMKVFDGYGGAFCSCCNESTVEFLTIDHIDGGGTKHRKSLGNLNGDSFYRWLIKNNFPNGFRVLCMNCNYSLGVRKYCPHKGKIRAIA